MLGWMLPLIEISYGKSHGCIDEPIERIKEGEKVSTFIISLSLKFRKLVRGQLFHLTHQWWLITWVDQNDTVRFVYIITVNKLLCACISHNL